MALKNLLKYSICISLFGFSFSSIASLSPASRNDAQGAKRNHYITDGFFVGGDKSIHTAKLKDIRRARSEKGFERIVFDLETNQGSLSLPFFQVQGSPKEQRLIVSLWADIKYDYDKTKVAKSFAKSKSVKKLNVIPTLEEGMSQIEMIVDSVNKKHVSFEVFHLSNPPRIIVDLM